MKEAICIASPIMGYCARSLMRTDVEPRPFNNDGGREIYTQHGRDNHLPNYPEHRLNKSSVVRPREVVHGST